MLSLDNTYNEAELHAFHARLVKLIESDDLRYTVEPKIDGLAVSLTYEDGKLVRAVTRGKGDRGDDVDVLALHEALERLAAFDPDQAKIVELRYFGGLNIEETAAATGVSPATVKREWAVARAWLRRDLSAT